MGNGLGFRHQDLEIPGRPGPRLTLLFFLKATRYRVLGICQITPYADVSPEQQHREHDEQKYALQFRRAYRGQVSSPVVREEASCKIDYAMPRIVNNVKIELQCFVARFQGTPPRSYCLRPQTRTRHTPEPRRPRSGFWLYRRCCKAGAATDTLY